MGEQIPYNAHSLERLLHDGEVMRALELGWAGSYRLHHLVDAAEGSWEVELFKSNSSLGLDLTAEQGVATVRSIRKESAAAKCKQLRPGDVVRSVDGHVYFTCEAVVEALRAHSKGTVRLGIVRLKPADAAPATPSSLWSESGSLHLRAGAMHAVMIEATAPAVLQYEFTCAAHDVSFCVRFIGELEDDGRTIDSGCGRGVLLDIRSNKHSGRVSLPNAGRYAAVLDNGFSMLRAKHVNFSLGLVNMLEYKSAEQHDHRVRLEAELDNRMIRNAHLTAILAQGEPQLAKLRSQVSDLEKKLKKARSEQKENERLMRESQAKLSALHQRIKQDVHESSK